MARDNPNARNHPRRDQVEIATDPDELDGVAGGPYADVVDETGDNLQTEEDESDASFEDALDDEDDFEDSDDDDTLTSGGGLA